MTEQDRIKCFLKSFNILTDSEMEDFIKLTHKKSLNKFDYFIREGGICSQVAFILSGIFRSYYVSDKDEEVTYCILFPDNFATAYSSFLTGQATQENIQAITQAELLIITKENVEKLVSKSHNWTCFSKKIAEQEYIELEKRIFQLQRSDATKRYSDLIKNQPEYIQKIPLQYLSSYLGITQRHLSRIRKEYSF